ncbi:hypothetical protein CC31p207 [Enterobacter phage CC31]|uniref:Uncharacterized protein n=1 Tax=Enterobacter phage CC31 TaxID=709484 RepID=E5DHT9_9CAUD|nr:hypothetical protein CC31p207 [Enterobacter phage CC31]ADB81703.1 hypothetical protein CC31p207 [Enterobacter phage CC31]
MSIIDKEFKLTESGVTCLKNRGSSYSDELLKLLNNGLTSFTVKKIDGGGNIIAIDVDGKLHHANVGVFNVVWCFFLATDIHKYLEEVKQASVDKDFWMMTIPASRSQSPFCVGPYTEDEATEKAQKQIRNAIEGVRVLIVKQVAEAKVKTVLETL